MITFLTTYLLVGLLCLVTLLSDGMFETKVSFMLKNMDLPDVDETFVVKVIYVIIMLFWPAVLLEMIKK